MDLANTYTDFVPSDIQHQSCDLDLNTELAVLSDDNKGVTLITDDRYIRITIDKSFKNGNSNETFSSTNIVKDKHLNTTETTIKKVFVHKNDKDEANVILREIFIDRFKNQSVNENRSIHIKLQENESLESRIQSFLQINPPQLMLN